MECKDVLDRLDEGGKPNGRISWIMPAQTCQCERSDARTGVSFVFGRSTPQIEIDKNFIPSVAPLKPEPESPTS